MRLYTLMAVFLLATISCRGANTTLESGPDQVSLLELFTSDGCSSCPPAEEWMSSLKNDPGLWKKFVPLTFHVDYWNSLGWPDRFSSAKFTRRQRDYATEWWTSTLYTPEFVLNGKEWKVGAGGTPVSPGNKPGVLKVTIDQNSMLAVSFQPVSPLKGKLSMYVAPFGSGIVSDVTRGENAGRKLRHDFVVLDLVMSYVGPSEVGSYEAQFVLPGKTEAPINGIAVWVCAAGSTAPIQAVGGPISITTSGE